MKTEEAVVAGRIKSWLLKVVGYLVPLVQSVPVWTGLMTLPFASYLALVFTNVPANFSSALALFFEPFLVIEKTVVVIGFLILVCSLSYLIMKRREGLVTSGPYGFVRHPQYLGIMLLTLGSTSWSVWVLNNTFGIGFLDPSQTIGVWFIELFAYILLSYVEEHDLARRYKESFEAYRVRVPFFVPFLKSRRRWIEVLSSVSVPAILLFGLVAWRQVSRMPPIP